MKNIGNKLVSGSIWRFFTLAVMVIITFFLTPFIIKQLGEEMFGLWSLISSLIGVSGFFDLGLSSALKRYFPKYYANNNIQKINEVFSSSLFLFSIIGASIAIFFILLIHPLHIWFAKEAAARIFNTLVIVMGMSAAIGFPMRTLLGYFESKLMYSLLAQIDLVKAIVRSILIYIFLSYEYTIVSMAVITFTVNSLGYVFLIAFFSIREKDIIITICNVKLNTFKLLFNYSYKNLIAAIGDVLRFKIDYFVIAKFVGLSAVTPYAISNKISNYFVEAISAFLGQTVPVFSHLEGKNDLDGLRNTYFFLVKISTVLSVYLGGMLIIMGKPFIQRWMGAGFDESYVVLTVLTFGLTIALSQVPTINLLRGISEHQIIMFCNIGEGFANISLSLILVRNYGIVGVALGTMLPMVVSKLILVPYLTSKKVSFITFYEFYFGGLLYSFIKSSLLIFGLYFIVTPFLVPDYLRLSIAWFFSLSYFPIIYLIAFSKDEKKYYLKIRDRIGRLCVGSAG